MRANMRYLVLLGLVLAACTVKAVGDPEKPITIKAHIIVDVREMKQTATSIEDMIAEEAITAEPKGTQTSSKLSMFKVAKRLFEVKSAYAAQSYDLKEITPAIQSALDDRKKNYKKLNVLKATNKVGENNEGYVESFSGDAEVRRLVGNENAARKVIYEAIVEQNGLPANSIYTVMSVFAEVQRDKVKPGEKMQLPNGDWVIKS